MPISQRERDTRTRRLQVFERMQELAAETRTRSLSSAERAEFDRIEIELAALDAEVDSYRRSPDVPETRGSSGARAAAADPFMPGARPVTRPGDRPVRGVEKEILRPDQSFAEWCEARGRGIDGSRRAAHDFDWNSYWAARWHREQNAETRAVVAMGEDISSGSGAGAGVVGQQWSREVFDLIRARTFLHELGCSVMGLETEITNAPEFLSDVAPTWVGEGSAVDLDITPSVGTIQFNAAGAFLDNCGISNNLIADAINNGGINALIQNSIAKRYALLFDSVGLYGQTGMTGNPGIANESNLLTQNASGTPTSYAPISKAAAKVREQNVEPSGWVWHPGTQAEFAQLTDTLGQPMRMTPDIAGLPNVASGLLNFGTEAGTALTGGSDSSLYIGDFSYVILGMRTEGVATRMLVERYAEMNVTSFFSSARFSIRTVHPEQTICRLYGLT